MAGPIVTLLVELRPTKVSMQPQSKTQMCGLRLSLDRPPPRYNNAVTFEVPNIAQLPVVFALIQLPED